MKIFRDLSIAGAIALAGILACTLAYPQLIMGNTITQSFVFHVTSGVVPAFYVAATGGNDTNPGTLASPFATFGACQTAMRNSGTVKTCYLRAGTYTPSKISDGACLFGFGYGSGGTPQGGEAISLTSADAGETWSYYPQDGVNTAIIDGQSTVGQSGTSVNSPVLGGPANGLGCGFAAAGANNVTVIGIRFTRFAWLAFWGSNAPGLIFKYNEVDHTTSASFDAGGVGLTCSSGTNLNTQIINNYFHDLAYTATEVVNNATGCTSGVTVANNVIKNVCTYPADTSQQNDQDGGDCGAIYFQDVNATPGQATSISITNNYIQDINVVSNAEGDCACGLGSSAIYLDDWASNVTATGNIAFGVMSHPYHIHGGNSNVFKFNIFDLNQPFLGASLYQNGYYQQSSHAGSSMTGNQILQNIFTTRLNGTGRGYHGDNSPPTPESISNNYYKNFVGSSINTGGINNAGTDSSPQQPGTDPLISCWAPQLDPASVTRNSPVNFPGITGGWGPPGFVMPQTGTAPSWTHTC